MGSKFLRHLLVAALAAAGLSACSRPSTAPAGPEAIQVDLLIRDGMIYDGGGGEPYSGDIAVDDGHIVAVGAELRQYTAATTVDAGGLAVSPGFINVLSWAPVSLIEDGRALSDIKQGVTLEIFGEGESMGPLSEASREEMLKTQSDIRFDIVWSTLGEYLDYIVDKGVSPNVASFVGASTVRAHEIGFANRAPTAAELARMQELVREAMREGALGVGSALIYAPGAYAKTDELIALAKAAGEFGGGYISHIRSEGDRFLEAVDELIEISRAAKVHGEIHHLKAAGQKNWPKMRQAIAKIEAAREQGLSISANMYPYNAGATGLDASMPPWVQEGGIDRWVERMKSPQIRQRVLKEMRAPDKDWESLYEAAGSAEKVLLIGFKNEKLKPLTGKTLAQVAKMRGVSPEDAAIDLVIEDHARVDTAYEVMSEENVRLGLSQPWVSLESDAGAPAPEGVFLRSSNHPRAYGAFARFLGHYVREKKVTTLPDAIRRLTRLPAQNWKLRDRGCLEQGCYADLVIFDPAQITDHATFAEPRLFATGVVHVFVNGVQVLNQGEHTGAKPGQVVRGPGWSRQAESASADSKSNSKPIVDVRFDAAYQTVEPSKGDKWLPTWAADGALYILNGDGPGFGNESNNIVIGKLAGDDPGSLQASLVHSMPEYAGLPQLGEAGPSWRATTLYSVDGALYMFVVCRLHPQYRCGMTPASGQTEKRIVFTNSSVVRSKDNGKTWTRSAEENFRQPMFRGSRFGAPAFVAYGRDGKAAVDNADQYVYAVSNDGYFEAGDNYVIGRVPRAKLASLNAADWSFYTGGDGMNDQGWTSRLDAAAPILTNSKRSSMTGVTHIPALQRYLMIGWSYNQPGTRDLSTTLEFFEAPKPWGPWTRFKTLNAGELGWYVPVVGQKFQVAQDVSSVRAIFYATGNFLNPDLLKLNFIPITLSSRPLEHKDPSYVGGR